jgi:ATP-binding cassette, subfamily B, bacterial
MNASSELVWPVARLADAVEALARSSGLALPPSKPSGVKWRREASGADSVEGGVEHLSRCLDFETEAADVLHADVERTLDNAGPALLKLTTDDGEGFFALLGSSGRTVRLLASDGRRHRVLTATLAARLRRHLEQPFDEQVDRLLADASVPAARRRAARMALLGARLGSNLATRCWMLRPAPSASLWQHMRHARLPRRLLVFIIAYLGTALASMGSWWLIGAAALGGRFDPGTLLAWSFLLLSVVPLGLFAMWSQGVFLLGVGGILKLQLLAGALNLDPDDTRHQGIGHHLARVIDSEAVESLAVTGGFFAIAAVFDLALAASILIVASRILQVFLVLLTAGAVGGLAVLYFRRRERWALARLRLTHDLVERMGGHRTRLVQETSARQHDDEDEELERYVVQSKQMDGAARLIWSAPRAWLLIGLAGLGPQFVAAGTSPGVLAVGVGATLLAYGAFAKLTTSLVALVDAVIAWKQVRPLLDALRRPEPSSPIDATAGELTAHARLPRTGPLIVAQDIGYTYSDRTAAALRGCSFRVAPGDRIHLAGASGGGKSTLVSLLTGLRLPDAGLLLLDGLDRATLGTRAWRRRVAAAPQFHENHLFNETLAFNLLMGRRWPPTADDLQWAQAVCRRLGLGDLLDRMPGGLFQIVGEAGWALSHGERSRVYMARALLQGTDLVVLDESFAELDPDSLRQCLPEAAELSKSLLVVAHT